MIPDFTALCLAFFQGQAGVWVRDLEAAGDLSLGDGVVSSRLSKGNRRGERGIGFLGPLSEIEVWFVCVWRGWCPCRTGL